LAVVAIEEFLTREVSPLIGTLPAETALLSNLRYFQINSFPVEGNLDGKFNAPNLETLILTKTSLAGPVPDDLFAKSPKLSVVDLSYSWLNGTIPQTLGSLTFLEDLQLNSNNFTGEVGEFYSGLTQLSTWACWMLCLFIYWFIYWICPNSHLIFSCCCVFV
jgi:hypothetical protein